MKGNGGRRGTFGSRISILLILAFCAGLFVGVPTTPADEYDPQEAGHPLKLIAYLAFPIGTLLDYGLMRPLYWVVQKEPFRTIFGYEYLAYDDEQVHLDPEKDLL
jgi:hypothetical protein